MDDPHDRDRHTSLAPLTADDDGEDFVVEVSSLASSPIQFWSRLTSSSWLHACVVAVARMWARLTSNPLWGRLTSGSWLPSWVPTSIATARHLWDHLLSSWLPAFAASTIRVWHRLTADSWVLAYYTLALRVGCHLALNAVRAWGRLVLSSLLAAYAAVPVRVWDYRLTRREKLRRGTVIAVSLLVAFAVIFGPGLASNIAALRPVARPTAHHAVPAAAYVSAAPQLGAWQSVPVPIAYNKPIAYTPAPDDPSTIYACGAGSSLHDSGFVPGNLLVWRTRDAGATWQELSLPLFLANLCTLRVAATAPSRVALLATTKGCQSYVAYLSDDGGDHWSSLTLPYASDALPGLHQCDLIATARHLYLWYSYSLESSESNDGSALLRSDDNGRSWKLASPGAPATSFCNVAVTTPLRAGDDDLLASCPPAGSASSPVLCQSTDAGLHWRTLGTIPASGASILFTPSPSMQLGQLASTPLYAVYTLSTNGGPSGQRLLQTLDGQHWQPLPPLPVPGASPGQLGIRSILGTTDDGRLFVLGVDPGVGVASSSSSSLSTAASSAPTDRWIWFWDPSDSRWSVMPSALPQFASFTCSDICWLTQVSWGSAAGGARLGPYVWAGSLPYNGNVLLRVFLPDVQSARVTRTGGGGSSR